MAATHKPTSQRALILSDVTDRIAAKFGPQTRNSWFRWVRRGPWTPGGQNLPGLTVVDDGQEKAIPKGDAEDSKQYILRYQLVIDLAADWGRQDETQDWSDRVEDIWKHLQNWLPARGLIRHDYVRDDPVDVYVGQAKVGSVWIVELEAEYFREVGELEKT